MSPGELDPAAPAPTQDELAEDFSPDPPAIAPPRGGGAITGLGEKLTVSQGTGTASLSIPLPTSKGRDGGVAPQLALSYDSGAGNGLYGLGWSVALPAVVRKTDKTVPRYLDVGPDQDVFLLSGAEDLVPELVEHNGNWHRPSEPPRTLADGSAWRVERFRPRTEKLFARIERWTALDGSSVHWRSISKDGVTSLYGTSRESRVADPDDERRVFSWLISETYDERGNAMLFRYVADSSAGVDTTQSHERNRTAQTRGANRHPKRILYGNPTPHTVGEDLWQRRDWLFELVFDYGEHDEDHPRPDDGGDPLCRRDPFSTYKPAFELRTYRLCQRLLWFHHFPNEPTIGDGYLVRSLDLAYRAPPGEAGATRAGEPVASMLASVTLNGYRRLDDGSYRKAPHPPLELEYAEATLHPGVHEVDADNLPEGIAGRHRWADLDGEGISGILSEQAGSWFFQRNVSPATAPPGDGAGWTAAFGPLEALSTQPSVADLSGGRQQLLDLEGDGRLELVQLEGPVAGYHSRTAEGAWEDFQAFESMPNIAWLDPNLRFADLTGDGRADALVTEDAELHWYRSLAGLGFGPEETAPQSRDEELGPRLLFADGERSVYLADLSGDGLVDLVRVRNGEVCYWPNRGPDSGFGAKVTMDGSPLFDPPGVFDQKRVRLADVDGSGPADLVYLGQDGVRIYPNQSGNRWGEARRVTSLPHVADPATISVVDLLGNGTACLVWSSPLPGDAGRSLRYVDLMGGRKPHLLVRVANNLGGETLVRYAASTKFYVDDRAAGRPWITRLSFPVQVVERVETRDRISDNRFVSRYAYHHGYFDGVEREFRGFGLIEQWDTEELGALAGRGASPPVLTRTWFHTGAHLDGAAISRQLADEYYREGDRSDGLSGLTDEQARAMQLDDTVLPDTIRLADDTRVSYELSEREAREACRALKGSLLRQEVYGLDGGDREDRPYSVSERNYTIETVQPRGPNQYPVFTSHAREAVDFRYERQLTEVGGRRVADPRVTHSFTFDVDRYGNALRSAAVAYGRRHDDPAAELTDADRAVQRRALLTCAELGYTAPVDEPEHYLVPRLCESRTYELLVPPPGGEPGITHLFGLEELDAKIAQAAEIPHEDVDAAPGPAPRRRLIRHMRMAFRRDDLAGPLPLGTVQPRALPYASYRLAFTPALIASVYARERPGLAPETLVPDPVATLGEGGYARGADLKAAGIFSAADPDDDWWIPSGRTFLSGAPGDSVAAELAWARDHFYLPVRFEDPFGGSTTIVRDAYDLLPVETRDALDNRVRAANDYRTLAPALVTDANGNETAILFDARGYVTATAIAGKPNEDVGDSLAGLEPEIDDAALQARFDDPLGDPHAVLGDASTRILYDVFAYARSAQATQPQPVVAYALARETHAAALDPGEQTKVQHRFTYTDGFGREVQHKAGAEPGPGGAPRWSGTGWRVFDNKSRVVREYEAFFSPTHRFEFAKQVGVSAINLYDPAGRVVATIRPDHSWEKTVAGAWGGERWDVNDTVLVEGEAGPVEDPADDPDVGAAVRRLDPADYLPTWYQARVGGALGADQQAAAVKAAAHASTPAATHVDPLGRVFLTLARNRREDGTVEAYATRVALDISGHQRRVVDPLGRLVERSWFDLAGVRIRDASMEAGERWTLSDVMGKPLRSWDSRGHTVRTTYDELRRPTGVFVRDGAGVERLVQRSTYGESRPDASSRNLRGRVYRACDGAGALTSPSYDFKGNQLEVTRELAVEHRSAPDWSQTVALEPALTVSTSFDALNRAVSRTTPDGATVFSYYNEAGLLERVEAKVRGAAGAVPFVKDVDYNARGQRVEVLYGNGVRTEYEYDPLTFRLVRQFTSRGAAYPGDCPNPAARPCGLENLTFAYDPSGNVVCARDDAQPTIVYAGDVVEPRADYVYDALYRLVEATGREHLGQTGAPVPPSPADAAQSAAPLPTQADAMGRYRQRYAYDAVGNLLEVVHRTPSAEGWRREYRYEEPSLLEPASANSDRLSSTQLGAGAAETYGHDAHGNVTRMPHLPSLTWDHADRLRTTSSQVVANGGTPETTYYAYEAGTQRARKATDRYAAAGAQPTRMKERIYLADFEVYREYDGSGTQITLERETLHIGDATGRVASVETRTAGTDPGPAQLVRYQLANPLGSSRLELAADGAVISYEEYYPHGGTSHQAVRSQTETPKRYRYAGKERDEESGLYHYGLRSYAPWLGRWLSCDPAENADGTNRYAFVRGNPMRLTDPTGGQTESPTAAEQEALTSDPALHDIGECPTVDPSELMCLRDGSPTSTESTPAVVSSTGPPDGSGEQSSTDPGLVGGMGQGLRAATPPGFTLSVPDTYDFTKMEAYQRGVLRAEIGRNGGRENPTGPRRADPAQRAGQAAFEGRTPAPVEPAPGGRGWAADHIIEMQHDLTERSGTRASDYRWQDSRLNSQEGSRSWALQRNNPFQEPAGGVVRAAEAGRWYNTPQARAVGHGLGTGLMAYGATMSTLHVVDAVQADVEQGTSGEQTARAVAHEAGGWAGALYVGGAVAPYGAACGPAAWICVPALGLVGGGVGYLAGSTAADLAIAGGQAVIE